MAQAVTTNAYQEEEEEISCRFLRKPGGGIEGCCDCPGYRATLDKFGAAQIQLDTN